jgi:hypothetical protein
VGDDAAGDAGTVGAAGGRLTTDGALLTTGRAEEMRVAASFGWSPSPPDCSDDPVAGSADDSSSDVDAAFFAGAFFAAVFLAAVLSSPSSPAPDFAAAFFRVGFDSSTGCCSRIKPSRSARARTRSACASIIDDEMPFTGMSRLPHRSINSWLVMPSSLASSWTR